MARNVESLQRREGGQQSCTAAHERAKEIGEKLTENKLECGNFLSGSSHYMRVSGEVERRPFEEKIF